MEKFDVPRSTLGYLVGKGGSHIKDLSQRSGTRMRVSFEDATVSVYGTPTARAAAKKLIETSVSEALGPGLRRKVSRMLALGDGFRKDGVTGVQFERYHGPLDCFNAGRTVYHLNGASDSSKENENEDTFLAMICDALRISDETVTSPAAVQGNRTKTIQNTGIHEVTDFIAEEFMKITDGGGVKDFEDDPKQMTMKLNYGYKLFHSRQGQVLTSLEPMSFDELPKLNIGGNGDITSFFLPRVPLDVYKRIQNYALKCGYKLSGSDEPDRLFRVNLNDGKSKMNYSSTLRIVTDEEGDETLEILSFSKGRLAAATADISSPMGGIDERIKIHVETLCEPPEWYVKWIAKTEISPSGFELELPDNDDALLAVSSIRYRERTLYCTESDKKGPQQTRASSTSKEEIDATANGKTGWTPSTYELSLSKTREDDSDYYELSLRVVPESILLNVSKTLGRDQVKKTVDGLLVESKRLTQVLYS